MVLGIDTDSDDDQIKKAYREKIKKAHPDTGGSIEEFRRVRQAYEKLKDKDSKSSTVEYLSKVIYPARVEFVDYQYVDSKGLDADRSVFSKEIPSDKGGYFVVQTGETILEAAERTGNSWPFSCRGGACSNCAVKVVEGDFKTPKYAILTDELLQKGYRLSCIGKPLTSNIKVIFGVRDHEEIRELLLPTRD